MKYRQSGVPLVRKPEKIYRTVIPVAEVCARCHTAILPYEWELVTHTAFPRGHIVCAECAKKYVDEGWVIV